MDVPRFRDLTAIFFRSGSFTLGGGNPIQAALHLELVERRRWLDSAEFALIYGLARFTPGTNVLACSAALAWRLGGWPAAIAKGPPLPEPADDDHSHDAGKKDAHGHAADSHGHH